MGQFHMIWHLLQIDSLTQQHHHSISNTGMTIIDAVTNMGKYFIKKTGEAGMNKKNRKGL